MSKIDTVAWRRPLRHRRALMVALALAFAGASLALGWDWLAAAGLAPVLLAALPCLAMCVLGFCLPRGKAEPRSRDGGKDTAPADGFDEGARR